VVVVAAEDKVADDKRQTQLKVFFAGVVFNQLCNALETPFEIELTRRFRGYKREFSSVAMTWKPELLDSDNKNPAPPTTTGQARDQ